MKAVIETHGHLRWLLQLMEKGKLVGKTLSRDAGLSLLAAESLEWPKLGGKSPDLSDGHIP